MARCLIGLGSNLPTRAGIQPAEILQAATGRLRGECGQVLRVSRWLATHPVGGPPGQPEFANGAVLLETSFSPQQLLAALQHIETGLERMRELRWGPRTVDLDLLLYDELLMETEVLVLPHPRMAFRRFVLVPAADVAGEMVHPATGLTVGGLLERLVPPWRIAVVGEQAEQVAEIAGKKLGELVARGRVCVWPESPAGILQSLPAPHLILWLESEAKSLVQRPYSAPVLRLPADDPDAVMREVVAAVQAMEYLPT